MMMTPNQNKSDGIKVSVIIPTHNRPDRLADTVAALRCQTLPANDYEIMVMDDGSTPPVVLTGEVENPICRVIRLENVERSAARNSGASVARGRLLVFLDDDIGVKENFLTAHLQAQTDWPRALIVGAIHLPLEVLETPFGRFRQALERNGLPQVRGLVELPNFCTAANMSIDRDLYFELGGFDCALKSGEDQELALRHTARDGQIVFLPEADVTHYDHSLDIQSYCQRIEWGSENILQFCQSWPAWPANIERQRSNGFLQFGNEPFSLSLRKIAKSIFGQKLLLLGLFKLIFLLEQTLPKSAGLCRLYQFLLGIHLLRGYRAGLLRLEANKPAQRALTMAQRKT
jgi:glycosyltransferase involved in cell wall biosynthesis